MPLPPVPKKFHKELTAGSTLYSVRWGDVARAGARVVLQVSPLHHCLVCPVFNGLGNTYLLPVTHVVTPPIFTALTFLAVEGQETRPAQLCLRLGFQGQPFGPDHEDGVGLRR